MDLLLRLTDGSSAAQVVSEVDATILQNDIEASIFSGSTTCVEFPFSRPVVTEFA